ncbi:AMP-binding protein [Patulibacter sp. NPDC049589]|uniref:AMP-binding protein n=1 Tax=Patulibacter sp. NPDC049589 TaxID=3154731 RepID=UPI003419F2ED
MRLSERIDVPVAPERAWRTIVDPRVIARTLPGVVSFEVLGDGPLAQGTRIRSVLRVGAAELGSELEVTVLRDGRDLVAVGLTGIDLHVALRVRPAGDGARITVRAGYNPPGGVPGAFAGLVALPEMRRRLREMLRGVERLLLSEEPPAPIPGPLQVAALAARSIRVFGRAGVLRPMRPDKYATIARQFARWGATPAGAYAAAATRDPHRMAIIDGDRALTYAELDQRTTALAVALRDRGVGEGHRVAIVCRNHRGFVEALVAVSKAGADALLVNTGFAAPQVRAVFDRERPTALVCDADLLCVMDEALGAATGAPPRPPGRAAADGVSRVVSAWDDEHPPRSGVRSLEELIVEGAGRPLAHPGAPGRVVLLTSGTTGVPKGTRRTRMSLDAPVSFLDRMDYRDGGTFLIAPPLFHAWGFANLLMALLLGSTVVLRRDFDPEDVLRAVARHGVDVLVAVPVMLQRILELDPALREEFDVSRLRVTASSGSALPGDLATRWMDAYGDGLYNLYGATEVGWGAIADPSDLRAAPATAGRVPLGATVRIFDWGGVPLPSHRTGRIHVGGGLASDRYTDGTRLPQRDGLTQTGDLGYLDDLGRLFVLGREDDMIVSGGENVHPRNVEDALAAHPAVAEVAAIGVADDLYGQRIAVHVVKAPGARLSAKVVREHVRAQRPRHEVPRDVVFRDELPRGATGKVLRRVLRDGPA